MTFHMLFFIVNNFVLFNFLLFFYFGYTLFHLFGLYLTFYGMQFCHITWHDILYYAVLLLWSSIVLPIILYTVYRHTVYHYTVYRNTVCRLNNTPWENWMKSLLLKLNSLNFFIRWITFLPEGHCSPGHGQQCAVFGRSCGPRWLSNRSRYRREKKEKLRYVLCARTYCVCIHACKCVCGVMCWVM